MKKLLLFIACLSIMSCTDNTRERDEKLKVAIISVHSTDKAAQVKADSISILSVDTLSEQEYLDMQAEAYRNTIRSEEENRKKEEQQIAEHPDVPELVKSAERYRAMREPELQENKRLLDSVMAVAAKAGKEKGYGYFVKAYLSLSRNGNTTIEGEMKYLVDRDMKQAKRYFDYEEERALFDKITSGSGK